MINLTLPNGTEVFVRTSPSGIIIQHVYQPAEGPRRLHVLDLGEGHAGHEVARAIAIGLLEAAEVELERTFPPTSLTDLGLDT